MNINDRPDTHHCYFVLWTTIVGNIDRWIADMKDSIRVRVTATFLHSEAATRLRMMVERLFNLSPYGNPKLVFAETQSCFQSIVLGIFQDFALCPIIGAGHCVGIDYFAMNSGRKTRKGGEKTERREWRLAANIDSETVHHCRGRTFLQDPSPVSNILKTCAFMVRLMLVI